MSHFTLQVSQTGHKKPMIGYDSRVESFKEPQSQPGFLGQRKALTLQQCLSQLMPMDNYNI